jgi:uroporphyrinogen III methyltransferase/synthase
MFDNSRSNEFTHRKSFRPGLVSLVGAGPGDPGLITVKGLEVLREAEAIVYDSLINPQLLKEARPEAELIHAGKRAGQHSMPQEAINALLVRLGREGKKVVRLKGGDPFVFGRGGEEAEALREAGIAFEVVPGISSAIAAAAYAGIPVTHRDHASSFTVITGHEDPKRPLDDSRINWQGLVRTGGTLVFLMGVGKLTEISVRLIEAGQDRQTPVALVHWGTGWQQKTVVGALHNIAEVARQSNIKPPAITVIGSVVNLREQLQWFDLEAVRPWLGKQVVLSYTAEQEAEKEAQATRLAELGARVIDFPLRKTVNPGSFEGLDSAIRRLKDFDWLIFSSSQQVEFFWQRLRLLRKDARAFGQCQVAATNPATATALEEHGLLPDLILTEVNNKTVCNLGEITGRKILLPGAEGSQHSFAEKLEALGARVEQIAAYRIIITEDATPGSVSPSELVELLRAGQIALVNFGSPEAVNDFAACLEAVSGQSLTELLANTTVGYGVTLPEFNAALLTADSAA